ncbi:MAG TPA: hypothetical protein DDW73_21100 [Rhizobium sp.]|jgi:hypothetical protein|nr:hypothetical protein [Rhizobium sp.]
MSIGFVDDKKINWVLSQNGVPVAIRRGNGYPLNVKLPYGQDNFLWLRNGRRLSPKWNKVPPQWEIPRAWFNDFVNRALSRYGNVYIIQPISEQEVCASSCWNASGHICECSCMGGNHGTSNNKGMFEVSETFAFRWTPQRLACRLLIKPLI